MACRSPDPISSSRTRRPMEWRRTATAAMRSSTPFCHWRRATQATVGTSAGGVADDVHVVGTLPNAQVRERLAAAHVYCQPSVVSRTWCEQFGFAVVEAMALGRPVVACDTGALREIVGEDGEYAGARNASALAAAIARVLDDPTAAARGARLAARARARYSASTQGALMRRVLLGGAA